MDKSYQIENIERLRRQQGIDDVELRGEVRSLVAGDTVKLTFITDAGAAETLVVRITSHKDGVWRGKLVDAPRLPGLAKLHTGATVRFTSDQIHSVVTGKS